MLLMQLNVDWSETTKTERSFSSVKKDTKLLYYQLSSVASSTLSAASVHSDAAVALATALAVITAFETLLRVACLSANVSTELLGLLLLMHLTGIQL